MRYTVFQVIDSLALGGAERVVTYLALYLNPVLFRTVCIAIEPPTHSHYETELEKAGIPLHFLYKHRPYDPKVYLRLHRLFLHYRPIVVHSHLGDLNYTYPLMLLHRVPVCVYTLHNVAEKVLHQRWSGRFIQYLGLRCRLGRLQPVAVSLEVQQTAERLFRWTDIPVIPNGIPVETFQPHEERRRAWRAQNGFTDSEILCVCVAGFREQKNHALLLRAFAKIAVPSVRLLLVGTGELETTMRNFAVQLGIEERVHFLGMRSDIPDILNASDIFVLTSSWEGNPMAIMEAMASGLPVVATAVGGVPELVQHGTTGFLVPPEEEKTLVSLLHRLVVDESLRKRMGQSARTYAQAEFDVRRMVKRYETLYTTLLGV